MCGRAAARCAPCAPFIAVFGAANRLQTARAPRAGDPRAVGLQSRVDRGVRTRGLLATRAVSASPAPEGGVCGPSLMQSHFFMNVRRLFLAFSGGFQVPPSLSVSARGQGRPARARKSIRLSFGSKTQYIPDSRPSQISRPVRLGYRLAQQETGAPGCDHLFAPFGFRPLSVSVPGLRLSARCGKARGRWETPDHRQSASPRRARTGARSTAATRSRRT